MYSVTTVQVSDRPRRFRGDLEGYARMNLCISSGGCCYLPVSTDDESLGASGFPPFRMWSACNSVTTDSTLGDRYE